MDLKYRIETKEFQEKLKKAERDVIQQAELLADLVAREVVQHARSLTSETKPGVKPGDGPRKVHPGGWGDIRGQLANSIQTRVKRDGLKVTAIVEAVAEYAGALDAKTGYSVLGGAEKVARKAIRKHGPKIFN
jgi:hypothetical protein